MSEIKPKRSDDRSRVVWGLAAGLRSLRVRKGFTTRELATRLGTTEAALSRIESSDELLLSTLHAYIRALGASVRITVEFPGSASFQLLGPASARLPDPRQLSLSGIADNTSRKDVVFSIRPQHAKKILAGDKQIELRRRFTEEIGSGSRAFIYCTSPISALTGFAQIGDVRRLPIKCIWRNYRAEVCIDKEEFDSYFSGCDHGYAIFLNTPEPLTRPLVLSELRRRFGFGPPQSYLYAPPKLLKYFGHEQLQNSH